MQGFMGESVITIILASSSRYRASLLKRLNIPFQAINPHIDEARLNGESARSMVERLSIAKARAIHELPKGSLVIGSDQAAVLNEKIIGKPGNHPAALAQLLEVSDRIIHFYTGLCVWNNTDDTVQVDCIECAVKFRCLTKAEINRYLLQEQPYDCAGSFRSEGYGITLFESISGSDPTALIGLPLIRLSAMLRNAGLHLP